MTDIKKIIEIVREAGAMFSRRDFDVSLKGSISDKVTTLDVEIEKFLRDKLTSFIEGSGFMGEESEAKGLSCEYVWVVDPIDGTTNFIRDFGVSCVSVALLRNGELEAGVVYNPYRNEVFHAQRGQGAYLNGKRIKTSGMPFENSIVMTSLHPYYKGNVQVVLNLITELYPQIDDTRRTGSAAIDLCMVACGRADMAFKVVLSPWDYAAAVLIIREAGGIAGTLGEGDITFDKVIPIIAANNIENYTKFKEIVERHLGAG
ncbi:MAG: inositol monophosphatase [Clostridia bacterium]|nr:inositol monophosphatase [Clostridia bacterium]